MSALYKFMIDIDIDTDIDIDPVRDFLTVAHLVAYPAD